VSSNKYSKLPDLLVSYLDPNVIGYNYYKNDQYYVEIQFIMGRDNCSCISILNELSQYIQTDIGRSLDMSIENVSFQGQPAMISQARMQSYTLTIRIHHSEVGNIYETLTLLSI